LSCNRTNPLIVYIKRPVTRRLNFVGIHDIRYQPLILLKLAKRYLSNGHNKYHMRFYEFKTIKLIQPLRPSDARISALKQAKDRAADALSAERTRQKQQKAREKLAKAQQGLAKSLTG
jgi:hypothetical protein